MSLAKWWGTLPHLFAQSGMTSYDLQAMAEFRDRVLEAERDAADRARYGLRADESPGKHKGRRGPRKGDTIERGGKPSGDIGW